MSALVTSEIFRLFVNTLTPDDKSSRRYMQTFWEQVQTPLSQKERDFFKIFYWISEICMRFRRFRKKEEYPSVIIIEIIASERDVYLRV